MTKLRLKYICGKILCKLFRVHTFDILKYRFDLKTAKDCKIHFRIEKCKFCNKTKEIWDSKADLIIAEKERLWRGRRRTIIEKHKNPKHYELRASIESDGQIVVFHSSFYDILDEDIEKERTKLMVGVTPWYLRLPTLKIDYICLDTEKEDKIPDYVYE